MGFFSDLFGKKEKRDTTYTGARPVPSLSGVQGGPEYYNAISGRVRGEGVGFGPNYATQYSNPIIANMRNQFSSYQLPELQSELSRTGRRRGSGGFDQIRRAYQEQGLAEGDIFSRLQQRNEDQERNEINAALADLGAYAQNEAELQNRRVMFDYQDHGRQLQEADSRQAANSAAAQRMVGMAGAGLSGLMGGGAGMVSGFSPMQSSLPPMNYYARMMPNMSYGDLYNTYSQYGQQGGVSPIKLRLK